MSKYILIAFLMSILYFSSCSTVKEEDFNYSSSAIGTTSVDISDYDLDSLAKLSKMSAKTIKNLQEQGFRYVPADGSFVSTGKDNSDFANNLFLSLISAEVSPNPITVGDATLKLRVTSAKSDLEQTIIAQATPLDLKCDIIFEEKIIHHFENPMCLGKEIISGTIFQKTGTYLAVCTLNNDKQITAQFMVIKKKKETIMKKNLSTVIALLLFVSSSLFAQPKLLVVNPSIDFGAKSYQNSPQVADIILKNVGTDTLKLIQIRPGCGCTTAKITNVNNPDSENDILPGDSVELRVLLEIKDFSGKIEKHVDITSNDPLSPSFRVMLYAHVKRPFELKPKYLTFDKVFVNEPATAEMKIINTSKSDAIVKSITCDNPSVKFNLNENDILKKGETYNLIATVTSDRKGSLRSKVIIELYHPDEEALQILVYGNAIIKP